MKNLLYKAFSISSVSVVLISCKPEVQMPAVNKGSLDLSHYVAVGNAMTAGYADNALYYDAQVMAYPNHLANQFKLAGGGEFKIPFVSASSVGIGAMQNARFLLSPVTDCQQVTSLAPLAAAGEGDFSIFTTSVAASGPFNNMGVPGLKSTTALYPGFGDPSRGQGNYNPYFMRMTADPSDASVLSDAASQNPTFFSLSIGNDDVMSYAIAGGSADAVTPSDGPVGVGFDASVDAIVNTLTANGAKGVIANIPDLSSIPYFTTIPYNALLLDKANADALSANYAPLNISFHEGYNGFIIEDATAANGLRQIQEGELVLLSVPQDSLKCKGWGSVKPIPAKYVLTSDEVYLITNAITAYNSKLKSLASSKGLSFVDVNAFMSSVKTGIIYNGFSVKSSFVSGGAFSLDGINLTPLGNALLANEFIKSVNNSYGSTIPQINAGRFKGVSFP